jgi:hypothetical protein
MFLARCTDSLQDSFLELFWPSRAAHGPARLRSAPRTRGDAAGGSPRHAARASPLRLSGPVGPARIPCSFSSTTVAVAVFAPLLKRAAPPPGFCPARGPCLACLLSPMGPARISGLPPWRRSSSLRSASARRRRRGSTPRAARASPLRFSGPVGPARIPRSFPSISASLFVRAGRSGPPLRRRSAVTTSGGDVCSAPGHPPPPPVGGDGGGLAPLPASDVLARCRWGTDWDLFLCPGCPGCARGTTFQCQ